MRARCPAPRLLILVALAALSGDAAGQSTVRDRMEAALSRLAAGDADAAIPLLLSVVDEVPLHGPARLQLGALAVARGEWAVAEDHLRTAIAATGPEAPEGAVPAQRPGLAWALLAEALDGRGQLEQGLAATAEALRFSPSFVPALLRRSELARRLAPGAGDAAARTDRLEKALEAARRATELAPDRPAPWTALALAAEAALVPPLASCAAERAAALAPDDGAVLLLAARVSREPDPAAALEWAESALTAGQTGDPTVWMLLGELRAFQMDLEGSFAAYREALRLDPAAAGEVASTALDALAAAADDELLTLLSERARRAPRALNTRFVLAKRDLRTGRIAEAIRKLIDLAAARPDHTAVLAALQTALRQSGDDEAADAVLARLERAQVAERAAWELQNDRERARRDAASAHERGDFAAAAARWAEARSGEADAGRAASVHAGLGRALVALGRTSEARTAFEASLVLRPFAPEVLDDAARLAETAGALERAARYRTRASFARCPEGVATGNPGHFDAESRLRIQTGPFLVQAPGFRTRLPRNTP